MLQKVKGFLQWHIAVKAAKVATIAVLGILVDAGLLSGAVHDALVALIHAVGATLPGS
jgi:hypothetical protein